MRLIDADELKDQIVDEIGIIPTADMKDAVPSAISFVNRLNMAPTIDAVPVVRCREFKHRYYYEEDGVAPVCTASMAYANTPDDWFCKDGQRRKEEP